MREWIRPALASPDLVLEAQPPAQPHSGVVVERPVRFLELGRSFVPLYLEIPAWSPVPGLFCSALSIARRLTRNRASPRRVHNRIAAGLAATVKLALCGFCTTDTNNILAENRWSLANRVRLHESVFIREFPVSCVGVRFLISREPCHAGAFAPSALGYIVQNCFARRQPRENRESRCWGC